MPSAERAFYYCQAICANKRFEAAKPLSREMSYGRRALEGKSPVDAAAQETCTESAGTARSGVGPWWDQPVVGSACGGISPWWGQPVVELVHGGISPWWDQPVVGSAHDGVSP